MGGRNRSWDDHAEDDIPELELDETPAPVPRSSRRRRSLLDRGGSSSSRTTSDVPSTPQVPDELPEPIIFERTTSDVPSSTPIVTEEDTDDPATPRAAEPRRQRPAERPSKPSLAERARKPKKMTAMEALQRAQEEEERKQRAAVEEAERVKKAALAKKLAEEAAARIELQRIEEEERSAAEEAEWARQAFSSASGPNVSVAGASNKAPVTDQIDVELPQGAEVVQVWADVKGAVVGPLMMSHEVRAMHEGDLSSAIAFGRIKRAVDNAMVEVVAVRVRFGGAEWAMWLLDDEVIGAFKPADLYLVGL